MKKGSATFLYFHKSYNLGQNVFEQTPKRQYFVFYHDRQVFQPPSPILQCCLLTRAILPQHCTMGEGMRQGGIQFHSKTGQSIYLNKPQNGNFLSFTMANKPFIPLPHSAMLYTDKGYSSSTLYNGRGN